MSSPSSPQRTSVLPDQASTFPIKELTDQQRDAFSSFIDVRKADSLNICEPIWLALLLDGERPATTITTLGQSITVEEVAEAFNLPHQRWSEHILHVARSVWCFNLLPTQGEITDSYHRQLGSFYGYPKKDVEHFISTDNNRTMPQDLVAEGIFEPKEVSYTTFVPQGHDDSVKGYKRVIEQGRINRETISECAKRWNLPELNAYADLVYHDALTNILVHS